MTTKAPVGPPICTRDPPSAEMRKPAMIGGVEAALRRDAAGDGKGDGQRQRDDPDDDAGYRIRQELRAIVCPERGEQLRNQHGASTGQGEPFNARAVQARRGPPGSARYRGSRPTADRARAPPTERGGDREDEQAPATRPPRRPRARRRERHEGRRIAYHLERRPDARRRPIPHRRQLGRAQRVDDRPALRQRRVEPLHEAAPCSGHPRASSWRPRCGLPPRAAGR